MKIKRYIVTAVDVGETCDGHARVLGCFKTEADAKNYVRNDMEDTCDSHANTGIQVDFDQMEIVDEDDDIVCCWSIDEIEVEVDESDVTDFCNEAYNKGYEDGINDHIRNSFL